MKTLHRTLPGVLLAWVCLFQAASAFALTRFVALAGVDTANSCLDAATPCATIQHAVDVAGSGDTVFIAAGVYNQRVRIENRTGLTLEAGGVTLRPDLAVLGPSDVPQGSPCSGGRGRAVVFVNGSTGIVLSGLVVDGSDVFAVPTETDRLAGIFYRNSSGAILGGGVTHLRTDPASSNQVAGLGIVVQTADPAPVPRPRVDIRGVTISDFQKTGIVFSGCDCAADAGPTGSVLRSVITTQTDPLVARNGIQVSFGAGDVVVEDNAVSGMRYTGNPTLGLGSALILASSRNNQVRGNTLSDSNFGISNIGDAFCAPRADENLANDIQCNRILGNDWGLSIDNNTHTIRGNDFSGNTVFAILTRTYFPAVQSDADASGNWWGSPTGPTIASNPGGTGDPLDDRVAFTPFLTAPSTCANDPVPVVPAASTAGLALLLLLLAGSALLRLRRAA
ncbi:MAG TPA: NosD domain-containing protein [Thermoanaerobaculia bacterium]|nr:NosD domain-containing protein [Thermoanaerobaculia bacterium]